MNTQMILNELSLIFQEILKRDNIVPYMCALPIYIHALFHEIPVRTYRTGLKGIKGDA